MSQVENLTLYHNTEGTSDKIWGYYSVTGTQQWFRFWGKRTANVYSEKTIEWDALRKLEAKKIADDYFEVPDHDPTFIDVKGKLLSKDNADVKTFLKSDVTGAAVAVEDALRPSQVRVSEEIWEGTREDGTFKGRIIFYDASDFEIGERDINLKEKIYKHLMRTKKPTKQRETKTPEGYKKTTFTWLPKE